jgi:hypothetical protein
LEPIPIKIRSGRLTPTERKVFNVIRRRHRPISERQLQKIDALDDVKDVGRTLRKLREKLWIKRIPEKGPNPVYEAIL